MSIVTVTGSAGHVGANLVRTLLARGHQVRALVHRDTRALDGLDVELVWGDVRDPDSLQQAFAGARWVFHVAAYISLSMHEWQRLESINAEGTRNVIQACRSCGVPRLVYFCSIEALEDKPLSTPMDESRSFIYSQRYAPYARSKAAAGQLVRLAQAEGLDAVILFPTAILGPLDWRLGSASSGLLALCRGRLWALLDGGFDWVDVRDLAEAAVRAAERAPAGRSYILSGHWASLQELAGIVSEINGVRVPRLVFPLGLARAVAPVTDLLGRLTGKRMLLTTATLRPLSMNRRISHAQATDELGYEPRPLEETVSDTMQWFESQGFLS